MLAAVAIVLWLVDFAAVPVAPTRVVLRSIAVTVEYLAVALLVGGQRGRGNGLRQFRLGPWSLLISAATAGIASLAWRNPQSGPLATINQSSVAHALAIIGLTAPLWAIGYLVGPGVFALRVGRRLAALATSQRGGEGGGTYRPTAMWVLAGVSVAARLAQIALGQFGFLADPSKAVSSASWYAQILVQVGGLGTAALAIAAVELARFGGTQRRTAFLVLLGTEVGLGLVSGMKGLFVYTLLAVCVSFAVARGRLPLRALLGAAAIFVLVVVPFNAEYRQLVRTHGKANLSAPEAVAIAPRVVAQTVEGDEGGDDGKDQPSLTKLVGSTVTGRSRSVDSLAAVVQKTPNLVPYRSVSELVTDPVLGLVPRALWPDKPVRTAGYTFNQEYYDTPADLYSSAAISPQADLFRHGGLLVLLVGSALIGAGYRLVDETLHPARDLRLTALYASLFSALLTSEWTVTDLLVSLPMKIGIMVIACRFVYSRRQSGNWPRVGRGPAPAARRGQAAGRVSGHPGALGAP